jgi:monoamine oxidase
MPGAGTIHDVAIIGAGSAGLSAAHTARQLGLDFVLLEASHRIGGRGHTEQFAPGIAFDLGCHWMHSASRNPYVAIADRFGFTYRKGTFPRGLWIEGKWANADDHASLEAFFDRSEAAMMAAAGSGNYVSVAEATERDNRWTPLLDYWISVASSADSDQVSVEDNHNYVDTGEDWPIREGYGALIAKFGAGLPLGTHNRIGLLFDRDVFGADNSNGGGSFLLPGDEPIGFSLRPFDQNYVVAFTGGRHAVWLERAGQQAAVDFAKDRLRKIFGGAITKHITRQIVTAWHGDPWVRGSYSAALPGQGHQRAELARPIDDRLYFAGEATSIDAHATAHGAYLTGAAAIQAIVASLAK